MHYLIRLPWPDKWLSPNAANGSRKARMAAHSAKKTARRMAWALAAEQGVACLPDAALRFSYYPPDRRRRDVQNMPAMLKAAIDGIADAMGCDDHKFRPQFPDHFCPPVKGGCVLVEVIPGDEAIIPFRGQIGG